MEFFRDLSVLGPIETYISEHKVNIAGEAAAPADDYVLTHEEEAWCPGPCSSGAHRESFSSERMWSAHPVREVGLNWKQDCGFREADKVGTFSHVFPPVIVTAPLVTSKPDRNERGVPEVWSFKEF